MRAVAALAPAVQPERACWLECDESFHVANAKLGKGAILGHVELLQCLRELVLSYNFKHSTAAQALTEVARAIGAGWRMAAGQ